MNAQGKVAENITQSHELRLGEFLPYRLSVAANKVAGLIARSYEARFQLTIPQWRLIAALGETPSMTQQELSLRTSMDKGAVSRTLGELERKGLAVVADDPTDKRASRVSLTVSGANLRNRIAPVALSHEAALVEGLKPNEIATLMKLLRRLEARAGSLDIGVSDS